jgi:hypothetical protein
MLTETELNRLIVSWKNQMGEEIKGRMCVPIEGRTEMYKNLIKTLIELHGYTQEDLEGKTYRTVMEASINPNSERKEGWRKAATADWNNAVDSFFPQKLLEHDSSSEPERPKRGYSRPAYTPQDEPVELEKPIDRTIFSELPKVTHVIDEDFLKQLEGIGDE